MTTFLSFVGSNDAGKLLGKGDEGVILTLLNERKFDRIHLLYNPDGRVKGTDIEYRQIADHLKEQIIEGKSCPEEDVNIVEMTFEDIASHSCVYPKLLDYLNKVYPENDRDNYEFYAGISSGTPAMQTSWVLMAEAGIFPIRLLRAVEKRHAKGNSRVMEVEMLTGVQSKLKELENLTQRIGKTKPGNEFVVTDSINLSDLQLDLAKTNHPILIYGETGVGKEVLAKTLHDKSGKKDFAPLNCAGLSENLFESELFGHKKGSFTGAFNDKKGLVEIYSSGTILLDEINSLSLYNQAKLLRFLNNGEYLPIGETKARKSFARIIAAGNEKISQLVAEGKFREDLYYRLRTIELFIPPLRERKEQIQGFIDKLLLGVKIAFTMEAIEALKNHDYKGNVRELKIILERIRLLKSSGRVDKSLVSKVLADFKRQDLPPDLTIPTELNGKAFKVLRHILAQAALKQTNGNSSAASEILGVAHTVAKKWAEEEV